MTNTFTWRVVGLKCYPRKNNFDNVVFEVQWECTATSNADPSIKASHADTTELSTDSGSYIPYDELTEAVVLNWVKAALGGVAQMVEGAMAEKVLEMSLPPVVAPALPWVIN